LQKPPSGSRRSPGNLRKMFLPTYLRHAASSHVTRGSKDVLEDVLDKEAGSKPKLVTQPAGVGSPIAVLPIAVSPIAVSPISGSPVAGSAIRHVSQGDLDAYITGQLFGPRLDFCRTHLDSCDECRAELEDLRNFKSSQAGLSIGGSLRRELDRRKRQKQLKAAATAAAVTVVVAAAAAVGWFEFVKPRLHGAAAVAASGAAAAPARNGAQAASSADTQTSAPAVATTTAVAARPGVATAQQATAAPQATAAQPNAEAHDTRIASARPRATPAAAPSAVPVAQPRGAAPATVPAAATVQPTAPQPHATPTAQPRGTAVASAQQPVAQPRTAAMAASNQVTGAPQAAIQSRGTAPATATTQPIGTARQAAQTVSAMASAAGNQAAGTTQPARQAANTSQARAAQAPAVQAPAMAAAAAGAPAASTTFALLGPFGDEISDDRPEFTWQPLAGATKYAVILVDEGLRPVAHTRVKTTSWRPRKPLRRGRTYLWQVTAILHNGTKVIGTGPTSVEARIHIAPPSGKHSDK